MEIVILNDTIQDLEEIIVITLIIKMVGTRVAIWEKSVPVIKNGETIKCNVCGSMYYWMKSCPDSYENQMNIKEGTNITLIVECMDTLIGETLSMAVLDSGYTKTICSKTWLNCFLESISSEELNNIKCERSETIFKFGNEKICHSLNRSQYQQLELSRICCLPLK